MIPRAFTAKFIPRDDGGIRVSSDDLPGLILSSNNVEGVMRDLLPAAEDLMRHNDPKFGVPDVVTIARGDLIELRQLVCIVADMNEAKETMPLIRRIDAALKD